VRDSNLQPADWAKRPILFKHGLQAQLLRVCKQLLEEGRVLLYGRNIIQFSPPCDTCGRFHRAWNQCRLSAIGARNRSLITKMEVCNVKYEKNKFLPVGRQWISSVLQYPELDKVTWFQFTPEDSYFGSMLGHMGSTLTWNTLEQAQDRAQTPAEKKTIQVVEDATVREMLLEAGAMMEAAGFNFDSAYHVKCRTGGTVTQEAIVNAVVLCKSASAPTSCPGTDRWHLLHYVCMHLCRICSLCPLTNPRLLSSRGWSQTMKAVGKAVGKTVRKALRKALREALRKAWGKAVGKAARQAARKVVGSEAE
jgi:hypothetical protein